MKIRSVGAELIHAGGQTQTDIHTYMTKLIVALRNFANAPKNKSNNVFSVHYSYSSYKALQPI